YLEEGFDPSEGRNEEREAPEELFERTPVYDVSLQDHLLEQLKDRELTPEVHELVEYLIYSLDDRGWLVAETLATDADDGAVAARAAAVAAAPADGDPRHLQVVALIEGRLEVAEADR